MKPRNLPIYVTESELRNIISSKITEVLDEETKLRISVNQMINEDYQHVIQEELGIHVNTETAADEIIEKIKSNFKNGTNIIKDNNGLKNYLGELDYVFEDKKLNIQYNIINFVTSNIFMQLCGNYNLTAEYSKKKNTIFVTIAMINGQFILDASYNSLQHELSHVFDNYKYKGYYVPEKEEKLYKMAVSQCENPVNELSHDLGMAMYISFKTEQIAMCNGLDALLRKNKDSLFDIHQTNEYNFLYYLKKVINNINDYEILIKRLYKMTPEKMLKRLTTPYYDYLRRIGRIVIRNKK